MKNWLHGLIFLGNEVGRAKYLATNCFPRTALTSLLIAIYYTSGGNRTAAPQIHLNGLRRQHSFIHQHSNIHVVGVSFYPYGLYPFVRQPMAKIKDMIVDLKELSGEFAAKIAALPDSADKQARLEDALLSVLRAEEEIIEKSNLISEFIRSDGVVTVKSFCAQREISAKTFERLFTRYTGYTPVTLRRIRRFQTASNQIVHGQPGGYRLW